MTNVDMATIVDHNQREQALRPEQSFIIQAPAGSGKTGLLIQRYLKLLAIVDAPEEIIAITFTRKAAAEMQGRILSAFEMAMQGAIPDNLHDKSIIDLANIALKRDNDRAWQIMENPGRLRIQTIDSLCASLARQMPLMSRLGTQPETLEDAEALYQQAAINTLAELESGEGWSDSIANLIFHLDNDLPRIKNLIVDMLKKRDQWLSYVVQQHDRKDMEHSLADLVEDQLHIAAAMFPEQFIDELIMLLQFAGKHLADSDPANPITNCVGIDSLPLTNADALDQWRGICELLLTKTGRWRKQFTVKNGFPPASANKLEADERSRRKQQMLALITELQKCDGLQQALVIISQLPAARYTDAEWRIVQALCDLLKLSAVQLRLIFAERNQMDFIGIAESAINALGTEDAPTDLAMTLDYQLKHILVDEYQDISVNQYRLLKGLTREWSMDDGRSLFLVGDPMQSIYRFREAEVGLFIKTFHEQCLGNIPLQALRLQVNFRSQQPLLEWVNTYFKEIMPKQDDVISGAVSFSDAVAHDKSNTNDNVVVYPLYGRRYLKEAEHTVDIIKQLKQREPEDTIAILVRSRSHLREIVPALRKNEISFRAIEIEALGTQVAIQDLLALTRAYLFPADHIAWLACLRAPWCGLSIASLFILSNKNRDKTVWQCINDDDLVKQLEADDKTRINKLKAIFFSAYDDRLRLPLRHTITSLWCQLGGPATLSSDTELENCETFFCLLEQLDKGGSIDDLQELIGHVSQLFAVPDQATDNPVQIMTMHKAKGLEFDHVILPGLGRSPRSSQGDLLVWLLRQGKQQQEQLILAPIREAGDKQAPIYDYINNTDKSKQLFEDARLLYVATTRSKKTLHLIGHASVKEAKNDYYCEPQSRSLLMHLWPAVKNVYAQYLPAEDNQNNETSYLLVKQETRRLSKQWLIPEPPIVPAWQTAIQYETEQQHDMIEFEWAGETIKHIGLVVHSAIQWIAEEGIEQWSEDRIFVEEDTFSRALQQQGLPEQEMTVAIRRVQDALINMLKHERGQWILSRSHDQQQNEYPISGMYKDKLVNVILDRTFIDEHDTRWIIDYKTSRHEGLDKEGFLDDEQERYRAQLEKYGTLMYQLGEHDIKLGLYFPLLQGWREWNFNKPV